MPVAPLAVVQDPRFLDHEVPSGHPERPERIGAVAAALSRIAQPPLLVPARQACDDEILHSHDAAHLEQLAAARGRHFRFDADTSSGPRSVDTARLAAGSTIDLALGVAGGKFRRGFALVRPPGHHAERSAAMGFCLLNQIAMAVHALRAETGIERIAVVDFDVHHGNGTQHILETDRDALFVSTHQFPFYPGTGALSEQGREAGAGATVNLPLPAGSGDTEYQLVFDAVITPLIREFSPELILVSAGFDAHASDPLGGMEVSTDGFGWIVRTLCQLADECCSGRLVFTLEGGYDLTALSDCVASAIDILGRDPMPSLTRKVEGDSKLIDLAGFRAAHGQYWGSVKPRPG